MRAFFEVLSRKGKCRKLLVNGLISLSLTHTHTHAPVMSANDAEARGQLIPELPEELVLAHVVPRLPWYTRPVCRALSKSWRARMDTRNPELDLRTRTIQLPLLRGLFLFCTFDKQIFISDHAIQGACRINGYQVQPHWRRLPPVQSLVAPSPIRTTMVASSGMVYVWSMCAWADGKELKFVLKLDIGCADCTWKKFPVPYAFNADAVTFNGNIYVPRISTDSAIPKKAVLAHDMSTDTCKQVETWVQDDLRVLSKSSHLNPLAEEMYGFVEEEFPTKLGIVIYDAMSDSWRTREEVPIPEFKWSHLPLVKLLNSECFEPAPETGTNIVWIDHESDLISWFNSSIGNTWVDIDYTAFFEGKYLEYIQFIRGLIYGIFLEDKEERGDAKEEEEDAEGLSDLSKRVIMKGRIIVASNSVAWEEVHEIGFFQEQYHVDCSMIRPIDWYTTMA